jgi:hypothetical protein
MTSREDAISSPVDESNRQLTDDVQTMKQKELYAEVENLRGSVRIVEHVCYIVCILLKLD